MAAGKGGAPATVKRFLNRGRYRNAAAGPDLAATAAVHVKSPGSGGGGAPLPPAVAEAYERVCGASGDKYGYAHGFGGQGYGGGIYGQAERAGAGGTGTPGEPKGAGEGAPMRVTWNDSVPLPSSPPLSTHCSPR